MSNQNDIIKKFEEMLNDQNFSEWLSVHWNEIYKLSTHGCHNFSHWYPTIMNDYNKITKEETFYIMTECGLREVYGIRLDQEFAITYNYKIDKYSITHINTGLSLGNNYDNFKLCYDSKDIDIKTAKEYINNNKEKIDKHIHTYDYCKKYNIFI